jgi:hypothetical protein
MTAPDVDRLETSLEDVSDLSEYPGNPRRGDVAAIAESLARNGQYRPIVVQRATRFVLAGNHTLRAARSLGWSHINVVWVDVDDDGARRIVAADNRTADLAENDDAALVALLRSLDGDLDGTGYSEPDYEALLAGLEHAAEHPDEGPVALTDVDAIPDTVEAADAVTQPGDLWLLGPHRLLCGDSTVPADVARVVGDLGPVTMLHADPPYGMGKEADGVLNDNLYREKLDAFQMGWWTAWSPALAENGSAYIWGTAPDLWRLWYSGGLGDSPDLLVRNEVVWDKGTGMGMRSASHHSYPTATERCLFLMRGQQFLGSLNKEDYWEGFEPLRAWLVAERDAAGWTNGDVNRITGTQMAGHWFTQSQFAPISERHYAALAAAADGRAFTEPYEALFSRLFPHLRDGGNEHRRELAAQLREGRSYFDNTHSAMTDVWRFPRVDVAAAAAAAALGGADDASVDPVTDVWRFPRVHGTDRHGHATPKPVAMVQRAFASSSRPGDVIGVPFGGSGPEFIAGHHLDRVVCAVELDPGYCDVIARRYQEHTGTVPRRVPAGTAEADAVPHSFTDRTEAAA